MFYVMNYSIRVPSLAAACFGILAVALITPTLAQAQLDNFFSDANFRGNFNLRLEIVNQDNALADAEAFTLSSRLVFESGSVNGFSATLEIKNVSIVGGIDNYSVGPTGFNPGQYSVIADPETTELDQGFIQYKNDDLSIRLGRQVVIYDNQRFIGHVGWRQDRQTFDAVTIEYQALDSLQLSYHYFDRRRRIFAEEADIESGDNIFHLTYTGDFGTLTGYAYLLESSEKNNKLDTVGLKFSKQVKIAGLSTSYFLELATQTSETDQKKNDASYFRIDAIVEIMPGINTRIGFEQLGSDSSQYGFSTILSTLHLHNGWGDLFLTTPKQGLQDIYASVSGNAFGGNWSLIYHDFSAEKETAGTDELGNEWDLQWVFPVSTSYTVGLKYAHYSSDTRTGPLPDTDKLWLWFNARF